LDIIQLVASPSWPGMALIINLIDLKLIIPRLQLHSSFSVHRIPFLNILWKT
jgi:hypothetical protein